MDQPTPPVYQPVIQIPPTAPRKPFFRKPLFFFVIIALLVFTLAYGGIYITLNSQLEQIHHQTEISNPQTTVPSPTSQQTQAVTTPPLFNIIAQWGPNVVWNTILRTNNFSYYPKTLAGYTRQGTWIDMDKGYTVSFFNSNYLHTNGWVDDTMQAAGGVDSQGFGFMMQASGKKTILNVNTLNQTANDAISKLPPGKIAAEATYACPCTHQITVFLSNPF